MHGILVSYCLSLAYKYLHIWPRQKARELRCPFSFVWCVLARPSDDFRLPEPAVPTLALPSFRLVFSPAVLTAFDRLPPSLNPVDTCLAIGAGGTACAAIYALHALGAGWTYLFNRTRQSAEKLVHTIPDANSELLNMLDVTSRRRASSPPVCWRS